MWKDLILSRKDFVYSLVLSTYMSDSSQARVEISLDLPSVVGTSATASEVAISIYGLIKNPSIKITENRSRTRLRQVYVLRGVFQSGVDSAKAFCPCTNGLHVAEAVLLG